MKKHILTLIAVITILSACKKDNNNSNPVGGGNGDFQPVSKGATWTYENEYYGLENAVDKETSVTTMTGETKTINGKKYFEVKVTSEGDEETQYLGINNNVYTTRIQDGEDALELPYFVDGKAVGESVITPLASEEGYQSQLKSTIAEKGISKVILGKTYTNVVHTVTEVQAKMGNTANIPQLQLPIFTLLRGLA